jgi:hypothetical protein
MYTIPSVYNPLPPNFLWLFPLIIQTCLVKPPHKGFPCMSAVIINSPPSLVLILWICLPSSISSLLFHHLTLHYGSICWLFPVCFVKMRP